MAGRKAGSIIPRGPNKHLIRWFVGRGVDGKRVYGSRTIEGTFPQAQKALGKETHDVAHGAYDCRHTHATLLLKADIKPKVVSERLGHASIVITLDTHSHVLPDMQEEAVDRLQALLKAAR